VTSLETTKQDTGYKILHCLKMSLLVFAYHFAVCQQIFIIFGMT